MNKAGLGEALAAYTNPEHPDYDARFDAEIRQLRPDWFVQECITFENLDKLIALYAPIAVDAAVWTRDGSEFDPDGQMILSDVNSVWAFRLTMIIFGRDISAIYVQETGFGGFSVEVMYTDRAGEALQFYNRLPERITGKVVKAAAKQHPEVGEELLRAWRRTQ